MSQHQFHVLPAILWETRAVFNDLFRYTYTDPSEWGRCALRRSQGDSEGLVGNVGNRRSYLNSQMSWFNWRGEKNKTEQTNEKKTSNPNNKKQAGAQEKLIPRESLGWGLDIWQLHELIQPKGHSSIAGKWLQGCVASILILFSDADSLYYSKEWVILERWHCVSASASSLLEETRCNHERLWEWTTKRLLYRTWHGAADATSCGCSTLLPLLWAINTRTVKNVWITGTLD